MENFNGSEYLGTEQVHLRLVTTSTDTSGGYKPHRKVEDIRGIATIKRNLVTFVEGIKARENLSRDSWLGGVLLYGPVGCGKVFAAEVVASELAATMYLVDVSTGWDRKVFAQSVRDIIDDASDPGIKVLHFENVDAPAAASLFASILDDLDEASRRGRLIISASATLPWQVSSNLVREGRLGRVLLVLPPDPPSRALFLNERIARRGTISQYDLDWIVEHTEGHSFNDLNELLDVAFEHAESPAVLDRSAIRIARRDVPPSSAQWLSTAGHHALMNQEGGMYDDLLNYFNMRQRR